MTDRLVLVDRDGHVATVRLNNPARLNAISRPMAEQLVEAGALRPEDVSTYPYRNVLLQAVGTHATIEPARSEVHLRRGDRILLCSDGLSGVVPPDKLETIVGQTSSLQDTCQALIDAANAAGGPDNITVAMLKVDVA